jgi:UDP-2,3-diacylglucosamine hydrolase
MKFLFLSDFHLGSPLFESTDKVISLLNDDYDVVFLLGDIIDTWEGYVWYIVDKNYKLIEKLNSLNNLVIIRGNHDPDLEELQRVFPNKIVNVDYEFHDGDKVGIVTHGDEFDHTVTKYYWLAKLFWPINWLFERLGINIKAFFRETYHSLAVKKDKKYYNDLILNVEKELVNKYKNKYHYIVVGHTHMPKLIVEDDYVYVNCGDWIHNKTYVIYKDGNFRLVGV